MSRSGLERVRTWNGWFPSTYRDKMQHTLWGVRVRRLDILHWFLAPVVMQIFKRGISSKRVLTQPLWTACFELQAVWVGLDFKFKHQEKKGSYLPGLEKKAGRHYYNITYVSNTGDLHTKDYRRCCTRINILENILGARLYFGNFRTNNWLLYSEGAYWRFGCSRLY